MFFYSSSLQLANIIINLVTCCENLLKGNSFLLLGYNCLKLILKLYFCLDKSLNTCQHFKFFNKLRNTHICISVNTCNGLLVVLRQKVGIFKVIVVWFWIGFLTFNYGSDGKFYLSIKFFRFTFLCCTLKILLFNFY